MLSQFDKHLSNRGTKYRKTLLRARGYIEYEKVWEMRPLNSFRCRLKFGERVWFPAALNLGVAVFFLKKEATVDAREARVKGDSPHGVRRGLASSNFNQLASS